MLKTLLIITLLANNNKFQEKRQLLVFADGITNKDLILQQRWLKADPDGLKERDIEVRYYYVNSDKAKFEQKKIKADFTVILVGKDGSDKLRETKPLTLTKLYGTIDAMPMRQSEMKRHP
jgi:hypothetical protein